MGKKLIEVAPFLPLDAISEASKADKDKKTGTIKNVHKWFAPCRRHGLFADVKHYAEVVREMVRKEVGHIYPKGPKGETIIACCGRRSTDPWRTGLPGCGTDSRRRSGTAAGCRSSGLVFVAGPAPLRG